MNKREMVVIGGGPAGLTAAIEAAKRNVDVLLIDESIKPGGQLFKQIHKFFGSSAHRSGTRGIDIGKDLVAEADQLGVDLWLNSVVSGLFKEKNIAVERQLEDGSKKLETIKAEKIVIATGASENAINFEGWTLPGVMGAGAAQTMINVHRVLPGEKVLMIGSGNVGLIVSYQLLQSGADVVGLVEAAPSIGGYGVHAAKIERAGVPIFTRHTIVEAKGDEKTGVKSAVIAEVDENWEIIAGTEKEFEVDVITIAAGLKPLGELANMHGCQKSYIPELGGWVPIHNENMESTCEGIYVVGDVTGVEEANTALEEGRLAGIDAALKLNYIDESEANNIKDKIRKRVNGLRLGPFGEKRLKAKERLIKDYQNLSKVVK
ncbi:MAG: NAD(P)/FAD-dependent oxidoreductase [Bacillota bacterium]